jgi:hypothetical protein
MAIKLDIPLFDEILALVLADLTLLALIAVALLSGVAPTPDTNITSSDITSGIIRYFLLAGSWYAVIKLTRFGFAKLNTRKVA